MPARNAGPRNAGRTRWPISESGYSPEELANVVGVSADALDDWLTGASRPNLTPAQTTSVDASPTPRGLAPT